MGSTQREMLNERFLENIKDMIKDSQDHKERYGHRDDLAAAILAETSRWIDQNNLPDEHDPQAKLSEMTHDLMKMAESTGTKYSRLIGWPRLEGLDAYELFRLAWRALGESLVYMNFIHGDIDWAWGGQRERVEAMCKRLCVGRKEHCEDTPENRKWWCEFLSDIADEVENQC